MRTTRTALLAILLLLGLLLPHGASARTQTVLGSVTITGSGGSPLTTELVGIALGHNPGLEHIIALHIPPFTFPIFVDVDKEDMGERVVNSRFEDTLVLTNTTGTSLTIVLTVRDASGMPVGSPTTKPLEAHATVLINLSTLLP